MKRSQLAINSVSTRHKDLEEALAAYANAGFKQVELVIPHAKQWMAPQGGPTRSVNDLKSLLARYGLTCIGGFEAALQCFGDEAKRKENHQLHIKNSQLIGELGGGTIVVGSDGDDKNNLDTLKAIGRTLRELIKEIHPSVRLAVEFNWSPVIKSLRSAAAVVEEACHGRVGILFDPAHYHCTPSKMEDLTEKVVRRIVHVHVDDMLDKPGDRSDCNGDRVLPGEGTLDLRAIFDRLEAFGYAGSYSIEMFNADLWAMSPGEAAKRMYAALARLCED